METAHPADEVGALSLDQFKRHPGALFAAIGADGLLVAMPASVGVDPSRVIRARSFLDVVADDDRLAVIKAWEAVRATGTGYTAARLAPPSVQRADIYFFDSQRRDGVYLGVMIARAESVGAAHLHVAGPLPPVSRFAQVKKSATGVFTEVDEATVRMFGWPRAELIGRQSLDFVNPEDHGTAIDSWMQILVDPTRPSRARIRHLCADGSWKWIEATLTNALDDIAGGYVLTEMLDVSDEMAALEALRAREQLLYRLAEALPTGVLQIDVNRKVVFANTRLGEVVGVVAGATSDERFGAVADVDRKHFDGALTRTLQAGADFDLEVGIRPTVGLARRCQIAIRALTAVDGAVTGAVLCATDVTESARLRADLERRATTDLPTGCRNRTWVMAQLAELVESDDDLAVIFMDLDEFKSINDRFGHAAGDEVLTMLAARLMGAVRATDTVGRVGGDEFLVVCPDVGGEAGARRLLLRVTTAAGRPGRLLDGVRLPGVSVGMAYVGGRHLTADQLVAEADSSMYRAKRAHQKDRRDRLALNLATATDT